MFQGNQHGGSTRCFLWRARAAYLPYSCWAKWPVQPMWCTSGKTSRRCIGVKKPNKWPEIQRFDYLIQTRELSESEADALLMAQDRKSYPQREAVRWALTKLSGEQ